jgi:hypothetical protein
MFFDAIVSHAERHKKSLAATGKIAQDAPVALLRSDNAFQVAEFYYLVDEFRLNTPERIASFIDKHNQDMDALLNTPDKMQLQGVQRARLIEAMFSSEQKAKVVENTVGGRLRLDQSDIGRFLAPLISPETCRKTLVAVANGGLFERINVGQVIIVSTGAIEGYYRQHLAHITNAVMAG